MPTVVNNRRATVEIVKAIQTKIQALPLPDPQPVAPPPGNDPPPPPPQPALFDRVALFDSEDLVEAFRFLLISEQRVCVIVPLDEHLEAPIDGLKLVVKRVLPVAILVSDRVLGDRSASLWGDGQGEFGASALMELVLPAVTGLLIANPNGVVALPRMISVMNVKESGKNLATRMTMLLELDCRGGWLETRLPAGMVL
jgi:hypothetical protein